MMMRRGTCLMGSFLAITCLVVFSGCAAKKDIKLALKAGDSHRLKVTQDLTISAKGLPMKMPMKQATTYRFDVESVDAAGAATVKVTIEEGGLPDFTEMLGGMGLPGVNAQPLQDAMKLDGHTFTMVMTPDGKVSSVQGMNAKIAEISGKVLEAMGGMFDSMKSMLPPEAKAMMEKQMIEAKNEMKSQIGKGLQQQAGDDSMREQMEGLFTMLPDKPVKIGETWQKTQVRMKANPCVITENWKLVKGQGGVLSMEATAQVDPNTQASSSGDDLMGMPGDVKGQITCTAELDEATGWIKKSTNAIKMADPKGDFSVEGNVWVEAV